MKHFLTAVTLAAAALSPASADSIAGGAFDCAFPISGGRQSLRRFALTASVYECMRHTGHADLAIVNDNGEPVPLRIGVPGETLDAAQYREELRAYREPDAPAYRTGEQLRRLARMTGVDAARNDDTAWQRENRFYSALILERDDTEDALQTITLDAGTGDMPVTATVTVEESDDLQHWRTRLNPRAVYFLPGETDRLTVNTLDLAGGSHAKYLRLAMLGSVADFAGRIARVTGEYERVQRTPPAWQWFAATGYRPLETAGEWAVSLPGLFPVSRLRFKPAETIVFYKGSVHARPHVNPAVDTDPRRLHEQSREKLKRVVSQTLKGDLKPPPAEDAWRYVSRFTQYRLVTGDATVSSADLNVAPRQSRRWKFVFEEPAELSEQTLPAVEFGWRPPEITFIAQGRGPFHLLAGRETPAPRPAFPAALNGADAQPVELLPVAAAPGETVPAEKTTSAQAARQTWVNIVLWVVLLAGVALMGTMAYRLAKSMKTG